MQLLIFFFFDPSLLYGPRSGEITDPSRNRCPVQYLTVQDSEARCAELQREAAAAERRSQAATVALAERDQEVARLLQEIDRGAQLLRQVGYPHQCCSDSLIKEVASECCHNGNVLRVKIWPIFFPEKSLPVVRYGMAMIL